MPDCADAHKLLFWLVGHFLRNILGVVFEYSNVTLVIDDDTLMLTKWFFDLQVRLSGTFCVIVTRTVRLYILRVLCFLRYLSTCVVFFISTILTIIFPLCLGQVVPLDLVEFLGQLPADVILGDLLYVSL